MGSPITEKRELYAALNNCAFVSTSDIADKNGKPSKPFAFLMDASMLGVGVGFDTVGADGKLTIPGPNTAAPPVAVQIEDSREGWVDSVASLIDAYFLNHAELVFDYSNIRPGGSPIKVSTKKNLSATRLSAQSISFSFSLSLSGFRRGELRS